MPMAAPRYAIYFCPDPSSALWQFGSSVLGYDSYNGATVAHPEMDAVSTASFATWSESPRRYGFHATLKAPFYLKEGVLETDVLHEAQQLARELNALEIGHLTIASLGKFAALVPESEAQLLHDLAWACVNCCENLRAPLTPRDRERRLAAGLTPRQMRYLDQFGYPFVKDEFRFHMTLTGPLGESEREHALATLRKIYSSIDVPAELDGISLARQEPEQPFTVIERFTLG